MSHRAMPRRSPRRAIVVSLLLGLGAVVFLDHSLSEPRESTHALAPGLEGNAKRPSVAPLLAPLTAGSGTRSIAGVVRDAHGPVGGAVVVAVKPAPPLSAQACPCGDPSEVSLAECGCDGIAALLEEQAVVQRDSEQPMARTETDATGGFSLHGLEAGAFRSRAAGRRRSP